MRGTPDNKEKGALEKRGEHSEGVGNDGEEVRGTLREKTKGCQRGAEKSPEREKTALKRYYERSDEEGKRRVKGTRSTPKERGKGGK